MKANYHTHTTRCQHACGADESYVKSALLAGYGELGFSDHCPWPYGKRFESDMRMTLEQLPGYIKSVCALREKYRGKISIRLGLECEYFPKYARWLRELKEKNNIDYLLFGNHFYLNEEDGRWFGAACDHRWLSQYLESSLAGMETGLYAYFAHPDLFMRGYREYDDYCTDVSRELCREARRRGMPLEYNLAGAMVNRRSGREGYPHHRFWEIAAEEGCSAIIGVDAHDNRWLEDDELRREGESFLRGLGMPLLQTIPGLPERA